MCQNRQFCNTLVIKRLHVSLKARKRSLAESKFKKRDLACVISKIIRKFAPNYIKNELLLRNNINKNKI